MHVDKEEGGDVECAVLTEGKIRARYKSGVLLQRLYGGEGGGGGGSRKHLGRLPKTEITLNYQVIAVL